MAIENSVSNIFYLRSSIADSVFDCRLPGVISMRFSVQTVNAIVKRPKVQCLKCCPSMQDPAQAKMCMFSYEKVSKECLTNGNSKRIDHFSKNNVL